MKNVVLILLLGISCKAFSQVELQEGVQYSENTSLLYSLHGISFKIPAGFSGSVPSGVSALVLTDPRKEITILLTADQFEENQVLEYLRNEIPLEQGISLIPTGTPEQQDKRWFGDYQVKGVAQEMRGYVEVRLGNFNIGAGCVVLALPNSFERGKTGAKDLLSSFQFREPVQTQYATAAGINQPWSQYLKGRSLKFYYTQGNFTESDFIHLCANGSFQRSKQSSSGGITGSGLVYGNNHGTWKALGDGDTGKLLLLHQDGTQSEFEIQYHQGNKGMGIYLNGYRYYAEMSNQCN